MKPRQSQGERMRARGERSCTNSQRPWPASDLHPAPPSSEAGGMLWSRPCAACDEGRKPASGLRGADCTQLKPPVGRRGGMTYQLSTPPMFERDPLAQSHCKCTLLAHVVWSTDQRISVLGQRFEPWLRDMMTAKAIEAGSRLLELGVADDHLHSLLRFPSTVTLAAVVQRLKGASSYECNQRQLLPQRLRWQRGYWAETVGPDAVGPLMHCARPSRLGRARGPHCTSLRSYSSVQYLATQREHHACQPMSDLFDECGAACCEPAAGGLELP